VVEASLSHGTVADLRAPSLDVTKLQNKLMPFTENSSIHPNKALRLASGGHRAAMIRKDRVQQMGKAGLIKSPFTTLCPPLPLSSVANIPPLYHHPSAAALSCFLSASPPEGCPPAEAIEHLSRNLPLEFLAAHSILRPGQLGEHFGSSKATLLFPFVLANSWVLFEIPPQLNGGSIVIRVTLPKLQQPFAKEVEAAVNARRDTWCQAVLPRNLRADLSLHASLPEFQFFSSRSPLSAPSDSGLLLLEHLRLRAPSCIQAQCPLTIRGYLSAQPGLAAPPGTVAAPSNSLPAGVRRVHASKRKSAAAGAAAGAAASAGVLAGKRKSAAAAADVLTKVRRTQAAAPAAPAPLPAVPLASSALPSAPPAAAGSTACSRGDSELPVPMDCGPPHAASQAPSSDLPPAFDAAALLMGNDDEVRDSFRCLSPLRVL
jgi:hypothetical protein